MSEEYKVKWKDITKIYNDRKLSGDQILRMFRELFEVEFFKDIIEINKTELEYRIKNIEKRREK